MVLAVSQGVALLFLFVVLPIVLAVVIVALVQWRSEPVPDEQRTSVLLRDGEPGTATLRGWRTPGQSFLDRHPMVTFLVEVHDEVPFEMEITQCVPRAVLRALEPGETVDVRLAPDRRAGAVILHR